MKIGLEPGVPQPLALLPEPHPNLSGYSDLPRSFRGHDYPNFTCRNKRVYILRKR